MIRDPSSPQNPEDKGPPHHAGHDDRNFIFHDPAGRRARLLRTGIICVSLLLLAAITWFVRCLLVAPDLVLPPSLIALRHDLKASDQLPSPLSAIGLENSWERYMPKGQNPRTPSSADVPDPGDNIKSAYLAAWDPWSKRSLEKNYPHLTHVILEAFTLDDFGGKFSTRIDLPSLDFLIEKNLSPVLLIRNLDPFADRWEPECLEELLRSENLGHASFSKNIATVCAEHRATALMVEWRNFDPAYRQNFNRLMALLATELQE